MCEKIRCLGSIIKTKLWLFDLDVYWKKAGKKIILFSSKPVPSPWPVGFSDIVVTNRKELVSELYKLM